MSQELAQRLIDRGLITTTALNEALQRQVVFGGSLDTNLLEVGATNEATLLAALGERLGLPVAGRDDIDRIGAHIPRLFPLVFAETYHLVPQRLSDQDLSVLVNAPPDVQLFQRIRERLRLEVTGVATTEVRLHYAMHRLYGTTLLPRFANLLKRLDGTVPVSASAPSDHVLSWGLSSAVISPTPMPRRGGDDKRRSLDVKGLLGKLDQATDRDTIVEVLLSVAVAVFDFAGLFAVHGDRIDGWRASSPDLTQRLLRVSLSVEMPSVFQTIYATGGHYLGPLPQNSINTKLLADMGRGSPRAALLAPISVGGRLAAILYADNGARGVSSKRVAAVLLLAQRAGMAFERLIRRRKPRADAALDSIPAAEATPAPPGAVPDGETWVVHEAAPAAEAGARASQGQAAVAPPSPDTTPGPAAAAPVLTLPGPSVTVREPWGTVRLSEVEGTEVDVLVEDEIVLEPEGDEVADDQPPPAVSPAVVAPPPPAAAAVDEPASADGYTAFADVSDSPTAALDDWEDVLIETAGLEGGARAAVKRASAAPPSVTWDDVIAEAERAQLRPADTGPVEVAGMVVHTKELLLDSLEAENPDVRRDAIDRLLALGTGIDDDLLERFPGRLSFDPLSPQTGLPPFKACSGVLELIAARGQSAAPVVLPHLESPDPVRRLFAIYFLHAVPYPPALAALARRLYDAEPKNRYLAAEALRAYAGEAGYTHVVQSLRDQLKVPILESQVSALQILGQLREPSAVPSLIPLVVAKRSELAGAAASALAVICGQAFGSDVARWAEWWQTHYNRPRPAWLIESLRHPSPAMVRLAHNELQLLSGRQVKLEAEGPAALREAGVREWETWWAQASRSYGAAR